MGKEGGGVRRKGGERCGREKDWQVKEKGQVRETNQGVKTRSGKQAYKKDK